MSNSQLLCLPHRNLRQLKSGMPDTTDNESGTVPGVQSQVVHSMCLWPLILQWISSALKWIQLNHRNYLGMGLVHHPTSTLARFITHLHPTYQVTLHTITLATLKPTLKASSAVYLGVRNSFGAPAQIKTRCSDKLGTSHLLEYYMFWPWSNL